MVNNSLNLIHLANFNSTNIGNGALISGLESTMSEDLSKKINWHREPWDDYTFKLVDFDEAFVSKVNASDGLIVGGAVTFNGRDYNHSTGSRFELPFELWSMVKKPVVFYGLSYRHWQGQTYHHLDKLSVMIQKILDSDNMVMSVRNDGTKKWISEQCGIDSDDIFEIPDSAVFVEHQNDAFYPELKEGARNVMVSFNDEDSVYRFDENGPRNKSRDYVIDELVASIVSLNDRYDLNIILCPHYFDDYRMMTSFLERVPPRIAHQKMVSTGLCRVKDTGYFYGRYRRADLALSMRVHSMSPCIGLGTPMVAYTTQDRMTNFMARIGLIDHSVNAFSDNASRELYSRACSALDDPEYVQKAFGDVRSNMRDSARSFHKYLDNFLTAK